MDMGGKEKGAVVYGFITTSHHWQIIRYHRKRFQKTDPFDVLFQTMGQGEP